MNKERDLKYEDIKVGDVFNFDDVVDEIKIKKFAEISGDYNPLHVDKNYAKKTKFKKTIVHGMLAASFFSTLVGMYCPGKRALYISQDIRFRQPISIGETVRITDGPFKDYDGKVAEIDKERGRIKVMVPVFGRDTAVELDSLQVRKL